MTAAATDASAAWFSTTRAATRLGCSAVTIWRLIKAEAIPAIRPGRAYRIPGEFVDDAYAAVMNGGQIDLADFGRQWVARNSAPARKEVA